MCGAYLIIKGWDCNSSIL